MQNQETIENSDEKVTAPETEKAPSFEDYGLQPELLDALKKIDYTKPTPIQEMTIPAIVKGDDILASAQTGSGKTGAFCIPILSKLIVNKSHTAIIVTPTRELAEQVFKMFLSLAKPLNINGAVLIGGASMHFQLRDLKRNPRFIVGTPGRINDHLGRGSLNLENTKYVVLDETDRMLDMGFGVQIDDILQHVKEEGRQTLLLSATLPKQIITLARKYLTNHVDITIGLQNTVADTVDQNSIFLKSHERFDKLKEVIDAMENGSCLIFSRTQKSAEALSRQLYQDGYKSFAIHGGLRQNQRERIIKGFRKGKHDILVATDVMSRGVDIDHINLVVNYDLPQSPEEYIHRIGRTGRAGKSGKAVSFISNDDRESRDSWRAIDRFLNEDSDTSYLDKKKSRSRRESDRNRGNRRNFRYKKDENGGGNNRFSRHDRGGFGQEREERFSRDGNSDRRFSGNRGEFSQDRENRPRRDGNRDGNSDRRFNNNRDRGDSPRREWSSDRENSTRSWGNNRDNRGDDSRNRSDRPRREGSSEGRGFQNSLERRDRDRRVDNNTKQRRVFKRVVRTPKSDEE